MTISSATLRLLHNAGVTGVTLIEVTESIERDIAQREISRNYNAIKQKRYRNKLGNKPVTQSVTNEVTNSVTQGSPLVPPSSMVSLTLSSLTTPPLNPPSKRAKTPCAPPEDYSDWMEDEEPPFVRVGNGWRLSPHWSLCEPWGKWAMTEFTVSSERVVAEARKFHEHFSSPDAKQPIKRDWKTAWRNWARTSFGGRRAA